MILIWECGVKSSLLQPAKNTTSVLNKTLSINLSICLTGALVMIIDDLSEMMNSSDVTLKTLTFLNDLIKYSTVRTHKKSKVSLDILIHIILLW